MVSPLVIPRLVLAAPASGAGKTTIATGLMAALAGRGLRVCAHKVGPDYIDPGYHALATGRPGRNLDVVLCGEGRIGGLFAHGAAGADLAVVEGVMGLFDGVASPVAGQDRDHASTAHVARLLGAPVVLVVDARGAGRSIAALVAGFAAFDRRVDLAGVILNRVGSDRHRALLTAALEGIGMAVFGAVGRDDAVVTPSRHLGLVPVAERAGAAAAAVRRLGALVAAGVDLAGLVRLARAAPALPVTAWDPAAALAAAHSPAAPAVTGVGSAAVRRGPAGAHGRTAAHGDRPAHPPAAALPAATGPHPPPNRADGAGGSGRAVGGPRHRDGGRPVRIALAGGAAFTFGYTEHTELLTAAGAEVLTVDPLRDEALPAGCDALVLGGGFPEEHADALSANTRLREQIAAFARRGAPVVAECAGLLYLARTLDGAPMCGVLDADTAMGPRLTLGYRHATAVTDSPLAAAGTAVRAHEFHRTRLTVDRPTLPGPAAWRLSTPAAGTRPAADSGGADLEGFVLARVHASYLHLHWAGLPSAPARLVAAARAAHDLEVSGR